MDLIINRRHIAQGHRSNPKCCPTAIALRAAGIKNIEVGTEKIRVYKCDVDLNTYTTDEAMIIRRVDMPKRLITAIQRFDFGDEFKPGVYRIPGLSKAKGGSR